MSALVGLGQLAQRGDLYERYGESVPKRVNFKMVDFRDVAGDPPSWGGYLGCYIPADSPEAGMGGGVKAKEYVRCYETMGEAARKTFDKSALVFEHVPARGECPICSLVMSTHTSALEHIASTHARDQPAAAKTARGMVIEAWEASDGPALEKVRKENRELKRLVRTPTPPWMVKDPQKLTVRIPLHALRVQYCAGRLDGLLTSRLDRPTLEVNFEVVDGKTVVGDFHPNTRPIEDWIMMKLEVRPRAMLRIHMSVLAK